MQILKMPNFFPVIKKLWLRWTPNVNTHSCGQWQRQDEENNADQTSALATTRLPPWFQLLHHRLPARLVLLLPPRVHQAGPPNPLLEEATPFKDSSQPSCTSFSSFSHSSWGQTLLQTLDKYWIGYWTNVPKTLESIGQTTWTILSKIYFGQHLSASKILELPELGLTLSRQSQCLCFCLGQGSLIHSH